MMNLIVLFITTLASPNKRMKNNNSDSINPFENLKSCSNEHSGIDIFENKYLVPFNENKSQDQKADTYKIQNKKNKQLYKNWCADTLDDSCREMLEPEWFIKLISNNEENEIKIFFRTAIEEAHKIKNIRIDNHFIGNDRASFKIIFERKCYVPNIVPIEKYILAYIDDFFYENFFHKEKLLGDFSSLFPCNRMLILNYCDAVFYSTVENPESILNIDLKNVLDTKYVENYKNIIQKGKTSFNITHIKQSFHANFEIKKIRRTMYNTKNNIFESLAFFNFKMLKLNKFMHLQIGSNNAFDGSCELNHVCSDLTIKNKNFFLGNYFLGSKIKIGSYNYFNNVIVNANVIIKNNVIIEKNVILGSCVVLEDGVRLSDNVIIGDKVKIGRNSVICKNVYIRTNSIIENDVKIYDNVFIDQNTIIENRVIISNRVIVKRYSCIEEDSKIENNVIILKGARISKKCTISNHVTIDGSIGESNNIENLVFIMGNTKELCVIRDRVIIRNCYINSYALIKNYVVLKNSIVSIPNQVISDYVVLYNNKNVESNKNYFIKICKDEPTASYQQKWEQMLLIQRQLDNTDEEMILE